MKIVFSGFNFLAVTLFLVLSLGSLILGHPAFAVKLTQYAFFFLVTGTGFYIWELMK